MYILHHVHCTYACTVETCNHSYTFVTIIIASYELEIRTISTAGLKLLNILSL